MTIAHQSVFFFPWGRRWQWAGVLACLMVLMTACFSVTINHGSVHLLMGMPSGVSDLRHGDDYLMIKRQYALSYNSTKGTANWVSWQLNASWLGTVDRCKGFAPDLTLPSGLKVVTPTDYTNSGFSRGHLTRSGDRSANEVDNCATFLMTNIVPQTQDNNEGPWLELENVARALARAGKELYIIAGPLGEGGTGLKGLRTVIGKHAVMVPERLWKIIVVLDRPGLGLRGVTAGTRVIAVNMPNQVGIQGTHYTDYLTTVDELERLTRYDFLSDLPVQTQVAIEAKKDRE